MGRKKSFWSNVNAYISLLFFLGIRLFLIRRAFTETRRFSLLKMLFYILPTGITFFMILDILGFGISFLRVILLLKKPVRDIKLFEERAAKKVGMSRMDWEGFKRQKAVGQVCLH